MRKLFSIAITLVTLTCSSTVAFAHAGLVTSNPAANSEVTEMPSKISLKFTEDLLTLSENQVNTLTVNLMDGPEIELINIKVDGAVLSANIPAATYESGNYEVFYKIVSADGHKLSDSFIFSLNAPAPEVASAPYQAKGDGVLPAPIVGAIAIIVILGLFIVFERRNRGNKGSN